MKSPPALLEYQRLPAFRGAKQPITYLNAQEVDALTEAFRAWYDSTQEGHFHRARGRFRELVRAEVAGTVSDPREIDSEMAELMRLLAS